MNLCIRHNEHTTECLYQHFLSYSGLRSSEESLRIAFYAGRNETVPAVVDTQCEKCESSQKTGAGQS